MFLADGVIVETQGNGTRNVTRATPSGVTHGDLPLVVLVNQLSASASEVLASALQDHRRAVLVGMETYGKGVVQTIRRFEPWGARAKVTSAYYYSPSGRNFERTLAEGQTTVIQPDVAILVDAQERKSISNYLGSHQPNAQEEALIRQWEAISGLKVLSPAPVDRALEMALDILLGKDLDLTN
jgi:carboxyl-terminal processing protease